MAFHAKLNLIKVGTVYVNPMAIVAIDQDGIRLVDGTSVALTDSERDALIEQCSVDDLSDYV